jgi:hypothetical protein
METASGGINEAGGPWQTLAQNIDISRDHFETRASPTRSRIVSKKAPGRLT